MLLFCRLTMLGRHHHKANSPPCPDDNTPSRMLVRQVIHMGGVCVFCTLPRAIRLRHPPSIVHHAQKILALFATCTYIASHPDSQHIIVRGLRCSEEERQGEAEQQRAQERVCCAADSPCSPSSRCRHILV